MQPKEAKNRQSQKWLGLEEEQQQDNNPTQAKQLYIFRAKSLFASKKPKQTSKNKQDTTKKKEALGDVGPWGPTSP